jgi:hypothetical protein
VPHIAGDLPRPSAIAGPGVGASARRPGLRRRALLAVAAGLVATSLLSPTALAEDPTAPPPPSSSPTAGATPDVSPSPAPDASPSSTPSAAPSVVPLVPASPAPSVGPAAEPATPPARVVITRNLYRADAVVEQYTNYWCVPASVQTMANLVLGTRDTSYATQKLLASVTFRFNRYLYRGKDNDTRGWAGALNWRIPDTLPVVYRDRSYATRTEALDAIVDAIEETGYPVGITVWHGAHAWSVVGYKISEVPGDRATRDILGFYVVGPLGLPRDPWPVQYLTEAEFVGDYTRYYEEEDREPWNMDYVVVRPEPTTRWSRDWPRP